MKQIRFGIKVPQVNKVFYSSFPREVVERWAKGLSTAIDNDEWMNMLSLRLWNL